MADWRKDRTKADLLDGIPSIVSSRKCTGRSTVRYTTEDGAEHIKYHDTVVLTIRKNGTIRLNSGGFRTVTTKSRMNEYQSVVNVWQEKGNWYCGAYGAYLPFFDGISFTKNGHLIGGKRAEAKQRVEKRRIKKTIRQINRYCAALKIDIDAGNVPRPEAGDCFICRFGDRPTCIQSHLDECYVHGTLVYNALKWAGYRNPEVILQLRVGNVVSTVRRYLRRQMEIA